MCSPIAPIQRLRSMGAAPLLFTISSAPIDSTSTPCLYKPLFIERAERRSSAGLLSHPASTTSGISARGTKTITPPIRAITTSVRMMNGTSTSAVMLAEAKKSRQRLQFTDRAGERAGGAAIAVHPDLQQPVEHPRPDIAVDIRSGKIHEIRAQDTPGRSRTRVMMASPIDSATSDSIA